jgi:peroxiredoxin
MLLPIVGDERSAMLRKYRVLIAGVLSLPLSIGVLSSFAAYAQSENDWLFRVIGLAGLETLMLPAMALPFLITIVFAFQDRSRRSFALSAKIGVAIGLLSLMLPLKFAGGVLIDWKQARNMAMHDVPAPLFTTTDLDGNTQSLNQQKGKVVLVNIWATWCGFCLDEMPKLEQLYQVHKGEGFVVFGFSDEDTETQRRCLKKVPVSYPLLTYQEQVPRFYRDIGGFPTTFVIDRRGKLHPALGGDQPLENLEATVAALLKQPSS